jgi:AcrR family transcriptional regulator
LSRERPSWNQTQTMALKQAIQSTALRLFAERGYAATTVSMIADEVAIATRTCFRHFPTKPDLVLWDAADYDVLAHFRARPAEEGVITAFRAAVRAGYAALSPEQHALERQRTALIAAISEVRAAHLDHLTAAASDFIAAVAARVGRELDDPDVRAVSGAILGIMMITQLDPARRATSTAQPEDPADAIDDALARLQRGFGTF